MTGVEVVSAEGCVFAWEPGKGFRERWYWIWPQKLIISLPAREGEGRAIQEEAWEKGTGPYLDLSSICHVAAGAVQEGSVASGEAGKAGQLAPKGSGMQS